LVPQTPHGKELTEKGTGYFLKFEKCLSFFCS